ncbi:MAG: UDP-N-acetylmuramoyl-tripeptide--D-alanyl-D-alanine ligase [Cytophagales bacterium]|nr:UDP-N-acetylmuramoyl-tripeptide--D-alanyl-D-alanine ligase [Cytophagales bacterium]MCA6365854.1 UDP-N-acetylmuramoyl-tripeptide--D-alanyl-D-alanine ligase [Cytophagales bacterium]MCA6371250.1 UDP-N-acetylmuramoyl-tripeptide--D-alanyl-D-alanine ligase [Cytophagales bacterium]MCA6374983.1 UDP-N-acetylmuramoyl-tripeptide--D-alanyl-D-alanine ligase [Cytophagales bacterium]MCA6382708.1 UDP-N-acetylmuramoyl-tripeptide--D-alanyl-D-alanine ligase [Cytophagales bacterium]
MDIASLYQLYLKSGKVSTDTRQIAPGSLFFAIKGPKYNANAFAQEALSKGASYAVVDEKEYVIGEQTILVQDGLTALQQLAMYHRDQLEIPVIGLTGSNGKTTSKELVNAVLSKKYKTLATKGNLNNHIGVPLTILSIDSSVEIAIIEMGANHVGEIALLSSIAMPTHGFITNIGKAHIGTFGGFENIIRGKSELYQHLITQDGVVFINSQNPILANMAKRFKNPIFYPAKGDYYQCELISADPFIKIQTEEGTILNTQMIGSYNFENIAAALCIGNYFGVEPGKAEQAVVEYVPVNMRSQIIQKGTNTIILDAYNANPSSMQAAVESLAGMKAKNKVAILGDMYELEEEAEKEHRTLGKLLQEKKLDRVYLCGTLIRAAKEECPAARHFETRELLIDELKKNPITDSTILVKASRGMGLEGVVVFL